MSMAGMDPMPFLGIDPGEVAGDPFLLLVTQAVAHEAADMRYDERRELARLTAQEVWSAVE